MRARIRQLWVTVLSVLILCGMGLQTLPVPCRSSHCDAVCSAACAACPPSCTCHLTAKLAVAKPLAAQGDVCGDPAPLRAAAGDHCHDPAATSAAQGDLCSGGVSTPVLPDFALPNPPPAAVLAVVPDLILPADSPACVVVHERAASGFVDPPLRPPLA